MDPLILLIEPELDDRAAAATMSRAQRVYEEGARDISRVMREQLTEGTEAAGRGFEDLETKARKAYLGMQDAADKVAAADRKAEAAKERGAANAEKFARQAERARLDEITAIERASAAYREYEQAATGAGQAGGDGFLSGLQGAISGAGQSGGDMASEFAGGFASSSALMRIGASGGPIGLAIAGVATLGYAAGKVLADNIAAGLGDLQMRDTFQARLGVDDATAARYGEVAGRAYANQFGASAEDNLRAVQFGVQAGVIAPGASDAEVGKTIANLQTLTQVMEVDVQEAARAAGQLMRGGFAEDGTQAADIIASGFQNGLDISGDWLDTITEYSTQFRKLGLDGTDAIGLISQGLQGAARDSDVVADSLKEFSIRAVDGSESTARGFAAIGFNADEMAQRFLAGGDSARDAFNSTLQAIRSLEDPQQQALAWVDLFGTQWEDMGDAINKMDLSTAREEIASTGGTIDGMTAKLAEHANGWEGLGRRVSNVLDGIQRDLADSGLGQFLSQGLPDFVSSTFLPPDLSAAEAKAAAARQAEAERRAMGSGFANAGDAQRARRGDSGVVSLTPGPRIPILTDTQQKAADEAEKAAGGAGASLPPAPVLPLQYRSTAGVDQSIASAMNRQDEVEHAIAERQARVNQLKSSNVATAEDILKAENDLAKAENDRIKADQSLVDAQTRAVEQQGKQLNKMAGDLGEFGAKIDDDFGISKGLGGIAENITKFLFNLAFTPAYAQLTAQREAAGFGQGEAGSGLMGMLANNGVFGADNVALPRWARAQQGGGSYGSAAMDPAALAGAGGTPYAGVPLGSSMDVTNQPGLDLLRSMGLKGTTYASHTDDGAPTDREIDVTDPSGGMGLTQLAEFARQNPSLFEEFIYSDPTTGQKTGIRSGQLVGPGTSQPGYYANNWAGHQDHAHIEPAKGGGLGFGDGPDDAGGPRWNADWNAIAQAESGGNWNINTGNGYYGGLQFAPDSWQGAGGGQYAPRADLASPYQQAMTAEELLKQQGPGAWPNTFVPGSSGPLPTGVGGGGSMLPGVGAPMAGPFGRGVAPSQSASGGRAFAQNLPESGGIGFSGGVIGAALSAAMSAGGAAAGGMGGGAAAAGGDMAMQLLGRAAGAAGQYAGNLVNAGLETFSLNGSALGDPSASWFGRLTTAASGVRPALPNTAGEMGGKDNPNMAEAGKEPPGPLTPEQAAQQQAAQAANGGQGEQKGGDTNITVNNNRAKEDGTGRDIQAALGSQQAAVQPR